MIGRILILVFLFLFFNCNGKPTEEQIEFEGKSVNVTSSIGEGYEYTLTDLTEEQKSILHKDLAYSRKLVAKYLKGEINNPYDANVLDSALENWIATSPPKEPAEEIVYALGAAFGQGIVEEMDFEWKFITDKNGTDLIVIDKKYFINAFPFSSVQKNFEQNARSLEDIILILKSQIEEAEKTGEAQTR